MEPAGKAGTRASDRACAAQLVAPTRVNFIRLPLLALSMFALLAALWAGLLRLGWGLPAIQLGLYTAHGPLIVSGFLGTLISLERAVALGESGAYVAPSLSGLGALALIAGAPDLPAALLIMLGSVGLITNFLAILHRQVALFTVTMALGAV